MLIHFSAIARLQVTYHHNPKFLPTTKYITITTKRKKKMDGFIKTVSSNMYGEVRTTMLNGELLLAATDIARCLGYSNPQKAIRDHCKTKGVTELFTPTSGGKQKIKFITKGNVIRLVANSNLPQAEQIESWIFDEVIPNVLEKGGYIVSKDGETPETLMARALLVAKETLNREKEKLQLAQNKITEDAPKVLFAEAVSMSKSSCLVSTLAKILKQNGIDMGEKRLYRWMREKGYLCSKGQYYNKP